jgi:hypothetical protein
MGPVFKKMNFKNQPEACVICAPDSFLPNLEVMEGLTTIKNRVEDVGTLFFGLAFVTKQAEVDSIAADFAEKPSSDGIIWFAYPKGSSKHYKCEFNRDNGWAVLGELGFEPVRMVSIDEDWTALRFRRVERIKNMSRSFAITKVGKERTRKNDGSTQE